MLTAFFSQDKRRLSLLKKSKTSRNFAGYDAFLNVVLRSGESESGRIQCKSFGETVIQFEGLLKQQQQRYAKEIC
jgi:hypothetical protein